MPAPLESLIRRCLSKDPAQRPGSATELLGELVRFLPPQARGPLLAVPKRERRKSLPLPLVKKSAEPSEDVHSEPALPLVKRGGSSAPASKRRAVLELVGDTTTLPGDDE